MTKKVKGELIQGFWSQDRLDTLRTYAYLPPIQIASVFRLTFSEFKKKINESKEAYYILHEARNDVMLESIASLRMNSKSGCFQSAKYLLNLYGGDNNEPLDEQLGGNDLSAEEIKTAIKALLHKHPELKPKQDE